MPAAPNITIGVKTKGVQKTVKDFDQLSAVTEKNERSVAALKREQAKQAKAERIQAARRARTIRSWKNYGKAVAAAAAAIAAREIIRNTAEFEDQLNRVAAVSGATGLAYQNLAAQARNLGSATRFAASEVAAGQAYLGQAGFKTNEILAATPPLLALATAGMLDLSRAADIASNIMGAFQIAASDTEDVADVLAKTASSSNTNIEQLGEALSYVGPVAYSAGLSLRDVATLVGTLGNNGIQASRAGTGLNTVLNRLLRPSTAAVAIFEKYNIQLRDQEGNLRNVVDILGELHGAGAKTEEFFAIFEQRGAPVALILGQQADQAKRFRTELQDTEGAVKDMADTIETGLGAALRELKSAWEGITISLGQNPILRDTIVTPLTALTDLLRFLTPEIEVLPQTIEELGEAYDKASAKIATAQKQLDALGDDTSRNAQRRRAVLERTIKLLAEERDATYTLTGLKKQVADLDREISVAHRRELPKLEKRRDELMEQIRATETAAYEARVAAVTPKATPAVPPDEAPSLVTSSDDAWDAAIKKAEGRARTAQARMEEFVKRNGTDFSGLLNPDEEAREKEAADWEKAIERAEAQAQTAKARIEEYVANTGTDFNELTVLKDADGWVKRLGNSFEGLGQKASESLKAIIVQGADARETLKRLLLTLGVDFLTGAFQPGGLFRPQAKNVGGTIYPGRAYRVHEDETIVPVGAPMQVMTASAGSGSPVTLNFAPVINAGDPAMVREVLQEEKEPFIREVMQVVNHDRARRNRRSQIGA